MTRKALRKTPQSDTITVHYGDDYLITRSRTDRTDFVLHYAGQEHNVCSIEDGITRRNDLAYDAARQAGQQAAPACFTYRIDPVAYTSDFAMILIDPNGHEETVGLATNYGDAAASMDELIAHLAVFDPADQSALAPSVSLRQAMVFYAERIALSQRAVEQTYWLAQQRLYVASQTGKAA